MLNVPEDDMFRSREELLAETYERQEERIAYDRSHPDGEKTWAAGR
jgi:hypothetical protein